MNELILIIVFIAVIFGGAFLLRKIKKPIVTYIRITMAILLLILIWWSWNFNGNRWAQILLTLLALWSLVGEFFNLKKFYAENNNRIRKIDR